jgi:hypothetical protein
MTLFPRILLLLLLLLLPTTFVIAVRKGALGGEVAMLRMPLLSVALEAPRSLAP